MVYPASFERDEAGRWLVRFVDLPGAHTDGVDEREAMEEAVDCLGSVLARMIGERASIPAPSVADAGLRGVPVPLWIAGKLALYRAMQEQGLTSAELARRLGVRETVVRRMLDPDHETKSERMDAALAAVGKRMVVSVEDAA